MAEVESGRYTVGVFKDVASAERGIEALKRQGFPAEALTMMAKDAPETSGLLQKVFGRVPGKVEVHGVGTTVAAGGLVTALDATAGELAKSWAGDEPEARRLPAARRQDLRDVDRTRRRAGGCVQRAAGCRRPFDAALLRRRERRHWRLDGPPVASPHVDRSQMTAGVVLMPRRRTGVDAGSAEYGARSYSRIVECPVWRSRAGAACRLSARRLNDVAKSKGSRRHSNCSEPMGRRER